VAVPVREGFIVAADRLTTGNDGSKLDEGPKLFPVARGVVTASGKTGIGTNPAGNNLFDAHAVMREQLSGKLPESVDWTTVRHALGTPLKRALDDMTADARPPVSTATASLLQVLTYYVDDAGALNLSAVFVKLRQVEPVLLDLDHKRAGPQNFELSRPLVAASVEVWNEIGNGVDPRFDDLRLLDVYQRFVSPARAEDTSADAGEAFARRLIRDTSERKHLIGGARDVGPTCDVVLVGRNGSVLRLGGDDDEQRRERNKRKRERRNR